MLGRKRKMNDNEKDVLRRIGIFMLGLAVPVAMFYISSLAGR